MDKKQEESLEESVRESSPADSEMASSIPRMVPDLREGLEKVIESPARGTPEMGSNMESPVVDTAESVQKPGTSKESPLPDTAEATQQSVTSKESVISKFEKSGLSGEGTGVAGTKSEVSAPGQSTEKSKSPGYSTVSVTPTEGEKVAKSEEVEEEEEADFESERRSARRYMVFKSLQMVLAATMILQVLSIWGYFVFILFFYVVIAVEPYKACQSAFVILSSISSIRGAMYSSRSPATKDSKPLL